MTELGRSGFYRHGVMLTPPAEALVVEQLVGVAIEAELGRLRSRGVTAEAVEVGRRWLAELRATAAAAGFACEPAKPVGGGGVVQSCHEVSSDVAAAVLGMSPQYVRRLCRDGRLEGRRVGGCWLIDESSVIALRDDREAGAA